MASGDLTYQATTEGVLSGAQRTTLASLLSQLWGGAVTDLSMVKFTKLADNTVRFQLIGLETKAPALVPLGSTILGRVP
jgi:hypothetical protein